MCIGFRLAQRIIDGLCGVFQISGRAENAFVHTVQPCPQIGHAPVDGFRAALHALALRGGFVQQLHANFRKADLTFVLQLFHLLAGRGQLAFGLGQLLVVLCLGTGQSLFTTCLQLCGQLFLLLLILGQRLHGGLALGFGLLQLLVQPGLFLIGPAHLLLLCGKLFLQALIFFLQRIAVFFQDQKFLFTLKKPLLKIRCLAARAGQFFLQGCIFGFLGFALAVQLFQLGAQIIVFTL